MTYISSSRSGALCLAFLFFIPVFVFGRQAWAEESGSAESTSPAARGPSDIHGRDDPFAPLEAKATAEPSPEEPSVQEKARDQRVELAPLCLHGIVWSPKLGLAIINNTVVGVGDRIEGRTIATIEREKVILQNDGGKEILEIETPAVNLTISGALRKE